MKRLISLILLLAFLAACGDTSPEVNLEETLSATAVSAVSYTITDGENSVNAGVLNDGVIGTTDTLSWQRGDRWNASNYPMYAEIDLGGVYDLDRLEYYVGNSGAEGVLSVRTRVAGSSYGAPVALKPQGTWDAYVSQSVTGEAQFIQIAFATTMSVYNVSELKVYGERVSGPATPTCEDGFLTPTAVVSQSVYSDAASATRLFDGETGTTGDLSWRHADNPWSAEQYPMSVTLDLGKLCTLSEIQYFSGENAGAGEVKLELSEDNNTYQTLNTPDTIYGDWSSAAAAKKARYVRLSFASPSERFFISEVRGVVGAGTDDEDGDNEEDDGDDGDNEPASCDPATQDCETYFDVLGMNYTWFHPEHPNEKNVGPNRTNRATEVSRHARWFLLNSKDYAKYDAEGKLEELRLPKDYPLAYCDIPNESTNENDTFRCANFTPGQNFHRIIELLKAHDGKVFLAPEGIFNEWPGKYWNANEIASTDPYHSSFTSGYQYATAYFKTLEQLPDFYESRIVFAMTNEEWKRQDADGADRKSTYDQYRRGFVAAHKDHVGRGGKVGIATGARQFDNRAAYNTTEAITDLPADVLDYVNSVGGYTSIHIHDRLPEVSGDSSAIYNGDVSTSYGIVQLKKMRQWLDSNYPNIKVYVGELSYTESEDDVEPTEAQRRTDAEVLADFVREALKYTRGEPVFLYQVDDHRYDDGILAPEGKFTGTNYGTDYANKYDVVEDLVTFAKEVIQ